ITGGQTSSSSINVNLLAPNSIYQDYYKIADFRLAKTMTMGKMRTTALAEFNNLFNMLSIASVTQNYGANWLRPATVQRGLNIRFGVQISYCPEIGRSRAGLEGPRRAPARGAGGATI